MQARIVHAVSQPLGGQRAEDILGRGPREHEPVDDLRIVGIEADLDRGHRRGSPGNTKERGPRSAPADDRMLPIDVVEMQASNRDR